MVSPKGKAQDKIKKVKPIAATNAYATNIFTPAITIFVSKLMKRKCDKMLEYLFFEFDTKFFREVDKEIGRL